MAYYHSGKYDEAITVYGTFFAVMKAIFKEACPPPYHDFDSGDCYLLLAKAYLAASQADKAMEAVEKSIMYYLNFMEKKEDRIHEIPISSSLIGKTELRHRIRTDTLKQKLLEKLSDQDIQKLRRRKRFVELLNTVNSMSK